MTDDRGNGGSAGQANDSLPAQIGPYRILDKLGSGGMADIYLAEQSEPVRRRVALKIVKAGMDSKQVLARFESERQALAVLDHPNIAKIFDGGVAESGRPYFVMERVNGVPITEYCDEHRLDMEARLRLFIDVCAAVQHAHLKGLIHRDLKPSNILVGVVDGKPQPKVIDFGIAKATTTTLTEATLYTRVGQLVGTPQYMSPEQADLSGIDIDTRADVYSLGVILYELLVGTVPIDLVAVGDQALQATLREKDPPKPSTRYTELGDTRDEIARVRGTDPDELKRKLKGDLDWIVMRAIEKDRTRRYETVNALAMECRRYLRHEPVLARPPSPGYLLRRFVRRNRIVVTAGAIAVLAIVGGAVAATVGMFRAIEAERHAATEAETANEVARFLVELFWSSDPFGSEELPADISARDLVELGSARVETELAGRPAIQARLMNALGIVLANLGKIDRGEELIEKAFRIRENDPSTGSADLAGSRFALGLLAYERGDYRQSVEHLETALALYEASGEKNSWAVADALELIASSYSQQGRFAEARDALERSGELFRQLPGIGHNDLAGNVNALGLTLYMMGDYVGARDAFESAARYFAGEAKTGLYARALTNLGAVYHLTGQLDAAVEAHDEALELKREVFGPEHIEVAFSLSNLGKLYIDLGEFDRAEALIREAIELFAATLGADHGNVAVVRINLGHVLRGQGEYSPAAEAYREALDGIRRVFGEGNVRELQALNGLAYLALDAGRSDEAETLFAEVIEKGGALGEPHPELGRAFVGSASIQGTQRTADERAARFEEGIGIIEAAGSEGSVAAIDARIRFARFLHDDGNGELARQAYEDALETLAASMQTRHPRYERYAREFADRFE